MANAVELRDLPDDELLIRLEAAKEELFNLRFQFATSQLDNPRRIKQNEIIGTLRALGCLKDTVAAQDGLSHELVKTVVRSTAEFALEQLIYSVL